MAGTRRRPSCAVRERSGRNVAPLEITRLQALSTAHSGIGKHPKRRRRPSPQACQRFALTREQQKKPSHAALDVIYPSSPQSVLNFDISLSGVPFSHGRREVFGDDQLPGRLALNGEFAPDSRSRKLLGAEVNCPPVFLVIETAWFIVIFQQSEGFFRFGFWSCDHSVRRAARRTCA